MLYAWKGWLSIKPACRRPAASGASGYRASCSIRSTAAGAKEPYAEKADLGSGELI